MKRSKSKSDYSGGPRVNHRIRVPEVRLVGDDGSAYGVVPIEEARQIAEGKGLDLVEISPNAKPPVVKIIDYGKYKYQQQKRVSDAKKKQAVTQLKEIKLRPNIERHDLDVKLKKAKQFIDDGDKVKFVMQFRGREMSFATVGMEKFRAILAEIVEHGSVVESEPKMMGNRIISMVSPSRKK